MLIIALLLLVLGEKFTLRDRLILGQAISKNSLEGLVRITKRILKYTCVFESIGAILYATQLVPVYGFWSGLFRSLFFSVSIFCDAGFDLLGANSMIPFAGNVVMNVTSNILMIVSSLGFLVWNDIAENIIESIKKRRGLKQTIQRFNLHTKIVLFAEIVLITIGTILFFIFEYDNLPGLNLGDKMTVSLFQSISSFTAGACTVRIPLLRNVTKIVFTILMFIGGNPGSMSGGIKMSTVIVLIAGVIANIRGKKNITFMRRTIPNEVFAKAATVFIISLLLVIVTSVIMISSCELSPIDIMFEASSAFATNGLSSGSFNEMNTLSQTIIMLLMYIGRVGTMTMALAFVVSAPRENDLVVYAKEDVVVG